MNRRKVKHLYCSSKKKNGVVILLSFILLAILGSLSLVFIYIVQTNRSSTTNWFFLRHVQILADNGVNLATAHLIKEIQTNPYIINESEVLTKDFDIDYKNFFSNNIDQIVNSSLSKYKQKLLAKEHEFAILTKDDTKFFGVKVFVKDASGKINVINPDSSAFKHFFNNLKSDKKIDLDIDFQYIYTQKFPHELRKYFSFYPATFNLFKYDNNSNKSYDEYTKFQDYFQKQFELEKRALININTADLDIIAYNFTGSEAVAIENIGCTLDSNPRKSEVFFENALKALQPSSKPLCMVNSKLKNTKKIYINSEKAKIIAEYLAQKRKQIQGWKSYKELFSNIKNDLKGSLTNDEIELTLSLIHPKPLLSQLHSYKNMVKAIDKLNVTKGGFEFSLSSDGFFEIYSAGLIFTTEKILAQHITFKIAKLFSKDVVFSFKEFKNKTLALTNTDFYPYSKTNLPANISELDGFISVAKIYDFCSSEEGKIFKYTFSDDTYLKNIGLFNIEKELSVINPKELNLLITKEGIYIPPYFSLLTNIDKTMEIKLLDQQEGDMPFCSGFSSVRPYIYLLNNFGINILFKTLKKSSHLSFEFTNNNISNFQSQVLNSTLIDDKLQLWFIDYPLTGEVTEQTISKIDELHWHFFSYFYYYKIDQIKRGKPTYEKFMILTKVDNQNLNIFPKENELYINTVFFEKLFSNQTILSIGGNLFPLIKSGILINGVCFYRALNYYESFYIPYQKRGSVEIINPNKGYKIKTNIYYFGEKVSLNDQSEANITKIDFNFVNEDNLPTLDIVEHLIFNKIQFLGSY